MKLEILTNYKSLDKVGYSLDSIPALVVLTGKNGCGKTHLLQSMINNSTALSESGKVIRDFLYFNYQDFIVKSSDELMAPNSGNRIQKYQDADGSDIQKLINTFQEKVRNLVHEALNMSTLSDNVKSLLSDFIFNVYLVQPKKKDDDYEEKIRDFLVQNKIITSDEIEKSKKILALVVSQIPKIPGYSTLSKRAHDLNNGIMALSFSSFEYTEDHLGRLVLEEIKDYRLKETNNDLERLRHERGEGTGFLDEKAFLEKNGPPPWEIINEVLSDYDCNSYKVDETSIPLPNLDQPQGNFRVDLYFKNENGVTVKPQDLSSGEKTLMALALTIYRQRKEHILPKVLLLDEIDANLHPSMIQQLLDVIMNVFVEQYGMKVFIATHSPTTVSLVEDNNVYVVDNSSQIPIKQTSREEGLQILTDGYVTLQEGLKLYDSLSNSDITIITEGKNTEHIKHALSVLGYNSHTFTILKGAESRSGKDQLRVLYNFFVLSPQHKKVLFVWDPDVFCDPKYSTLSETDNTFKFIFETSTGEFSSGIESLYPPQILNECKYDETVKDGTVVKKLDKGKVLNKILEDNSTATFSKYNTLIEKLDQILEPQ